MFIKINKNNIFAYLILRLNWFINICFFNKIIFNIYIIDILFCYNYKIIK